LPRMGRSSAASPVPCCARNAPASSIRPVPDRFWRVTIHSLFAGWVFRLGFGPNRIIEAQWVASRAGQTPIDPPCSNRDRWVRFSVGDRASGLDRRYRTRSWCPVRKKIRNERIYCLYCAATFDPRPLGSRGSMARRAMHGSPPQGWSKSMSFYTRTGPHWHWAWMKRHWRTPGTRHYRPLVISIPRGGD